MLRQNSRHYSKSFICCNSSLGLEKLRERERERERDPEFAMIKRRSQCLAIADYIANPCMRKHNAENSIYHTIIYATSWKPELGYCTADQAS